MKCEYTEYNLYTLHFRYLTSFFTPTRWIGCETSISVSFRSNGYIATREFCVSVALGIVYAAALCAT